MIKLIAEFSTTNRAGQRGAVWFAPKGWIVVLRHGGHFSADNGNDDASIRETKDSPQGGPRSIQ